MMIAHQPEKDLSSLPREALVRWPTVKRVIPVSHSTWNNGVKSGRYPKSYQIGKRSVAWRWGEILDYLDSLRDAA